MITWIKNRLFGEKRSIGGDSTWITGPNTTSGVAITPESAMGITAVYCAVNVLSTDVAKLSFQTYRRNASGGRQIDSTHPVYDLIHNSPDGELTAFNFRQTLMSHVLTYGNGFAEIQRLGSGQPIALHILHPKDMTVFRTNDGRLFYKFQGHNSTDRNIPADDMLHVRGLSSNGIIGHSPITQARQAIGLAAAMETYGASLFGNSAMPKGFLEVPGKIPPDALKNLRDSWNQMHQGPQNGNKLAILEQGLKWVQTSISPEDCQFLLSRQFQISEIARMYNLPPHKIGDYTHATFSNIEECNLDYYITTLMPWLESIEQEFNQKLFTKAERTIWYVEHSMNSLLRGNMSARSAFYREMFNIGAMTINQILARENENPIGEEGDKHYVAVNLAAIEDRVDTSIPSVPPVHTDLQDEATASAITDNTLSDSALNGSQIEGLNTIISAFTSGAIPLETLRHIIMAAFPTMSADRVTGIIESLRTQETKDVKPSDTALDAVRGVLHDSIGRMIRRECSALRRASKKPDEFATFIDGFYKEHRSLVIEAIKPAVRMYCSVAESNTDADGLADAVASDMVIESRATLANGVALDCTLDAWEESRANAVVSRIMD